MLNGNEYKCIACKQGSQLKMCLRETLKYFTKFDTLLKTQRSNRTTKAYLCRGIMVKEGYFIKSHWPFYTHLTYFFSLIK